MPSAAGGQADDALPSLLTQLRHSVDYSVQQVGIENPGIWLSHHAGVPAIGRTPVARSGPYQRFPGLLSFVQTQTLAAVLRGELDTGIFQRALDFGEGLDGPADWAMAAFHALHGGDVAAGPLGKLARGPVQERACRANLVRSQHAPKSINLLQSCDKGQQRCSELMKH